MTMHMAARSAPTRPPLRCPGCDRILPCAWEHRPQVRWCDGCGVGYTDPPPWPPAPPPPPQGPLQPPPRWRRTLKRLWVSLLADEAPLWVRSWLPPAQDAWLVDVGCGDGRYVRAMALLGWRTIGLERAAVSLQWARQVTVRPLIQADAHILPLAPTCVHAITLWHVLEHLWDPLTALRAMQRVLASDGQLLVEVPNVHSVQARVWGPRWFHWDLERHIWHFSPTTLQQVLTRAGFRVVKWRTPANGPGWTESGGWSRRWMSVFTLLDSLWALGGRGGVVRVCARVMGGTPCTVKGPSRSS